MLMSMTGFARRTGEVRDLRWACEVKSLNGRGLDIRCRLPPSFDALEAPVRTLVQERFARGTINVNLSLDRLSGGAELRLNRPVLDQVLRIASELEHLRGVTPARLDGLLALKGVLDIAEPAEDPQGLALREAALLQGIADTLDGLKSARKSEGAHLSTIIEGHIARIAQLSAEARRLAEGLQDTIRGRIKSQVAALLEAQATLDPARLAQETALIFARGDVTEELDRITAHVAQARTLAASGEPAGRRFEFLAQEFNREANTLCSKSISVELTRTGLELKAVIDQFREQIQNVE
jgi:uncharacterized protein (TIGR00255 family)